MENYRIIASGSTGNCVIYRNIMVDCGVPFKAIKSHINDLDIILLTHEHGDHIKLSTIKKIQLERPSIRVACGDFLLAKLNGVRNIDIVDIGKLYNYGKFKISPIKLYHDVKNYGWRIFFDEYKILHATDTQHLKGLSAKGYDLYSIEHNYDEGKVNNAILDAQLSGDFCRCQGSVNSHLSYQQAFEFISKNKKESSETIELHRSSTYY